MNNHYIETNVNDKTSHYEYIRNVAPYLDGEDAIDDSSFLLLDISVDGYNSSETKELTYNIAKIPYDGKSSMLDVGCGVGDLYGFLQQNTTFDISNYKGIDFNENKVSLAKKKYNDINVSQMDLYEVDEQYDYIFALNVFNDKIYEDMNSYLYDSIEKLYSITNKCLIFNVLNENTDIDNSTVNYNFSLISDLITKYDFFMHRAEYMYGESMIYIFKPHSI